MSEDQHEQFENTGTIRTAHDRLRNFTVFATSLPRVGEDFCRKGTEKVLAVGLAIFVGSGETAVKGKELRRSRKKARERRFELRKLPISRCVTFRLLTFYEAIN
nr:hypothetical protein [uncultured Desulfobulbus sp.]